MQTNYDSMNEIKILIADDHELIRIGIKRLLSVDKSLKVVDEASNGIDAIKLAEYHKPDIILLDILMPRMNGIEATKIIKETMPGIFVIMLTAFEDRVHVENALLAGANGYLSKDISAQELIKSIRIVLSGERAFSTSIIRLLQNKHSEYTIDNTPVVITKREQEILNLVALGKTSPEIANELFLSIRTIESHRYNLMQKLGVKNTAGLVRYAISNKDASQII
jgi:DNA-binding NarL/FixJ family response regulator